MEHPIFPQAVGIAMLWDPRWQFYGHCKLVSWLCSLRESKVTSLNASCYASYTQTPKCEQDYTTNIEFRHRKNSKVQGNSISFNENFNKLFAWGAFNVRANLSFVPLDLHNDTRIVNNKCHFLCQKCIFNKMPPEALPDWLSWFFDSPHTENLEITHIKIIARVDARVYTVASFFLYKNSALKPQAKVFLFFYWFNAEIYLWLFLVDYREEYVLPFHLYTLDFIVLYNIFWRLFSLGYILYSQNFLHFSLDIVMQEIRIIA